MKSTNSFQIIQMTSSLLVLDLKLGRVKSRLEQPTGMWGFPPVCGRYHMPTDLKNDTYVPLACVTSGRAGRNDMPFSWVFVEFSFMGGGLADTPTTSKWYMCNYVKQYSVHLCGYPFLLSWPFNHPNNTKCTHTIPVIT